VSSKEGTPPPAVRNGENVTARGSMAKQNLTKSERKRNFEREKGTWGRKKKTQWCTQKKKKKPKKKKKKNKKLRGRPAVEGRRGTSRKRAKRGPRALQSRKEEEKKTKNSKRAVPDSEDN